MDERHRSLTPQERQEFDEIQARLATEMPEVESDRSEWTRWKRRLAVVAVLAGLGLLAAGLVVTVVVLAFVGFVVLVFALGWISARVRTAHVVDRARSVVSPARPDDDGTGRLR